MNDGRLPGGGTKSPDATRDFEFERRKIIEQTKNISAALDRFTGAAKFSDGDGKKIKENFQEFCRLLIDKAKSAVKIPQSSLQTEVDELCSVLITVEKLALGMIEAFAAGKGPIDSENISLLSMSISILIESREKLSAIKLQDGQRVLWKDRLRRV